MKHIVLSIVATLGIFCAVLYTSCSKDACKGTTCFNKGTCVGGLCQCVTGIEGTNCEVVYRKRYANTYRGNTPNNVGHAKFNNTLTFQEGTDTTDFNKMTLVWFDTSGYAVTMPITLRDHSAAGSNFTVTETTYGNKKYIGNGTVNANTASLHLTETDVSGGVVYLTFSDFYKQ
ncbi:MAG: hypothetical protein V4649_01715 [Bacteroidota bacterium]